MTTALVLGLVVLATAADLVSPTAVPTTPPRDAVGVLFGPGAGAAHSCTASVVSSASHELVLTAAHCIVGTGAGTVFAPGFHDGVSPYGTWVVQRAFASARWVTRQDPLTDYAFLVVAPSPHNPTPARVEDVVGADRLDRAPSGSRTVAVSGYALGTGGRPVRCTATVSLTGPYPTFPCAGFVGGTSGGPWVEVGGDPRVVGVIGGLHQGGCVDTTSYSAPFDDETLATYERATTDLDPDVLPAPLAADC